MGRALNVMFHRSRKHPTHHSKRRSSRCTGHHRRRNIPQRHHSRAILQMETGQEISRRRQPYLIDVRRTRQFSPPPLQPTTHIHGCTKCHSRRWQQSYRHLIPHPRRHRSKIPCATVHIITSSRQHSNRNPISR